MYETVQQISDSLFPAIMAVANGVINAPLFGRFSVEKQESLLKITILSIAAILAFSTRLFSVLRYSFFNKLFGRTIKYYCNAGLNLSSMSLILTLTTVQPNIYRKEDSTISTTGLMTEPGIPWVVLSEAPFTQGSWSLPVPSSTSSTPFT